MNESEIAEFLSIINNNDIEQMRLFYNNNPNCLSVPLFTLGRYAIHVAARLGHFDLVCFMIVKEPGLLEKGDWYEQTPLFHAVDKGHIKVVHYLLNKGANYLAQTMSSELEGHQRTIIEWALKLNYKDCSEVLHQAQLKKIKNRLSNKNIDITTTYFCSVEEAIISQNAQALKYLLLETNYLLLLKLRYRFELLATAQAILPPEMLSIFLHPEVIQNFNKPDKSLLQQSIKYKLNNLIALMVLDNSAALPEEHKKEFIALARASDNRYIHNILIVFLFRQFVETGIDDVNEAQSEWKPDDLFHSYLKTGKQVIELAAMDSRLIPYLIATPHVQTLLENDSSITSSGKRRVAYYPRDLKRRLSLFAEVTPSSLSIYQPEQMISKGSFGMVSKYSNERKDAVAVKAIFRSSIEHVRAEGILGELAYPEKFSHSFFSNATDHRGLVQQKRLVMPYFHGVSLGDGLDLIKTEADFAELVLKAAQKLLHFHAVGCIHNDIKEDNFIVSRDEHGFVVELVDFGLSFYRDDDVAKKLSVGAFSIHAPEVRDTTPAPAIPHPRMDIYSFGHMIDELMSCLPRQIRSMNDFPMVKEFCSLAMKENPLERPQSLKDFCERLSQALKNSDLVCAGPSSSSGCRA